MFTWDEPRAPFPFAADRRQAMYARELRERAALLQRLGHTHKDVKQRLRAAVRWEFELHGTPPHLAEVDAVVDGVFQRNKR